MGWADAWVALDTETTGFGLDARIIEIGVTRFEQGLPTYSWSSLLYPAGVDWEAKGVREALAVNGITRDELIGKPLFAQIYPTLLDVMQGFVWVAHNVEFDFRMFMQECNRLGRLGLLQIPELALCTKTLAYHLEPDLPNHKLETVAGRWRVTQKHAHRAQDDATTAGAVLSEMYGDCLLPDDDQRMATLFRASQHNWNNKKRRKTA